MVVSLGVFDILPKLTRRPPALFRDDFVPYFFYTLIESIECSIKCAADGFMLNIVLCNVCLRFCGYQRLGTTGTMTRIGVSFGSIESLLLL